MDTTNSSKELAEALCLAQSEVEAAVKGSTNPHFRNKYADISEIIKTVRHVYNKYGISILQEDSFSDGMAHVHTTFLHKSGASITSKPASCIPAKFDAQGLGSSWTYLRRYALSALCCLAQEDDDGQSASHDRKPAAVVVKPIAVSSPKITLTQVAEINARIKNLKVDEDAFLKFYKIKAVHDMTQDSFENAQSRLAGTEAKQNKAAMSMAQTEPA
jgi:hypothetical protein